MITKNSTPLIILVDKVRISFLGNELLKYIPTVNQQEFITSEKLKELKVKYPKSLIFSKLYFSDEEYLSTKSTDVISFSKSEALT